MSVELHQVTKTYVAVKCNFCGRLHEQDGEDYLTIHGNICVGMGGGVVGNNLDEEGRVVKVTVVCRRDACVKDLVKTFQIPSIVCPQPGQVFPDGYPK